MSSKQPWLIGCGIGCGAAILVIGTLLGGSYFFLKRTQRQAEDFSARVEEMTGRFGPLEDHRLPLGEADRRESVARFLTIREELSDPIADLEDRLERLAHRAEDGGFGPLDVLALTRDLPGLVSALLDYLSLRTEALLGRDMSLGEYLYLYAVVYYASLQNRPDDGPPFQLISESEDDSPRWDRDEDLVRREREQRVRAIVHDLTLPMLRRQLEEATEQGEGTEAWRASLAAEVERLEEYPSALPWEEGLPAGLETWIDELGQRLQASYSPMLNPIEIGTYDQK